LRLSGGRSRKRVVRASQHALPADKGFRTGGDTSRVAPALTWGRTSAGGWPVTANGTVESGHRGRQPTWETIVSILYIGNAHLATKVGIVISSIPTGGAVSVSYT
jgi:hypothetical protein